MFRNKNWLKVLVPEVLAVVLVLVVFFVCKWLGMDDDQTVVALIVATTATFVVATIVATAVAVAATAAATTATAAATAFATTTATPFFAVAFAAFFAIAIAIAIAIAAFAAAEEYKLSRFFVVMSYLAEGAAIFLPIFFSLN